MRAAVAVPSFDPTRQQAAVAEVVARLGGIPLAIELAAARLGVMGPAEIAARLDRSLELLTRGRRDLPERHRSLRAALEWTMELLAPQERTLFARLAAFTGPALRDALDRVAGSPPGSPPLAATDALMGLLDASLVQRSEDRRHGLRFAMAQAARDCPGSLSSPSRGATDARTEAAALATGVGHEHALALVVLDGPDRGVAIMPPAVLGPSR